LLSGAEGTQGTGRQVVIRGGRLYWPGRSIAAPGDALPAPGRLERVRNTILLLTVSLYLLFNWGFMQLRVPPGGGLGLPVGEIVLFMTLATLSYASVLGRLAAIVALLPFVIWWGFGLSRALFDFVFVGAWALRDAAHVIESLFLLAGFVLASHPASLERFFRWLPWILGAGVVYGLLYPLRFEIWALSPTIVTAHGFEVPILGTMANTAYVMIPAALYLILFHGNRLPAILLAVLILGYTIAMFQARTLYLVMIAVFGFLVLYRRSSIGHVALIVYISGLLLALVTLLGLQFQGRLGAAFSFDFLVQHFLAIFGIASSEYQGIASAAAGVGQRLEWWNNILAQMLSNPFKLLLGLGYGVVLTDFYGVGGIAVREPHNSYITVFARTGIIGATAWALMMLVMVRRWHLAVRHCREIGWRLGENRLLVLMVYFICMWVLALGEDGFEKPYNVIPFYFFWGIVLRFALLLERGEIGPEAEAEAAAYEPSRLEEVLGGRTGPRD